MRARFHAEARLDFLNAATRYASVRPELGRGFCRHIDELIAEMHFKQPPSYWAHRLDRA
jgi:hypothetical protein